MTFMQEIIRMLRAFTLRARALFARVASLVLVCALLSSSFGAADAAAADRYWYWSKIGRKRNWTYSLSLGLRGFMHYNRSTLLSTPPESYLGEADLTAWYKHGFALYSFYGMAALKGPASIYGAGIKYPFLALQGPSMSFITGISMNLHFDGYHYSLRQPVAPEAFTPSGFSYRYGGSIDWGIGKRGFFLDTTMMVGPVSGNFFIMPFVGMGYQF